MKTVFGIAAGLFVLLFWISSIPDPTYLVAAAWQVVYVLTIIFVLVSVILGLRDMGERITRNEAHRR